MTAQEVFNYFQDKGVSKSYTIAFSLRCGSTVLSNTLSTHGLGYPTEYFQYPYSSNVFFENDTGQSMLDQFQLLVLGHLQRGMFGSKMAHDHRAHLDDHLRNCLAGYNSVNDVLPGHKWIFMQRKDTIAQAISLYVASSSNQWHVLSDDNDVEHQNIPYDFFSILYNLMVIGANNVNWETYFSLMNIQPHRIIFEDLVSDPSAIISSIFKYMDLDQNISDVILESDGGLKSISQQSKLVYKSLKGRFIEDFIKIGQTDDSMRLGPSLEKWDNFYSQKKWQNL